MSAVSPATPAAGPRAGRRLVRVAARRVLRRRLLAVVVAGLVAAGAFLAVRASSAFSVEHVRVRGIEGPRRQAVTREVRRIVDGRSLLALDAADVARRLEALPSIAEAWVDRSFPHTLAVRVAPEEPAATVAVGSRRLLVARSGRVIAELGGADRRPGLTLLAAAGSPLAPGERVRHRAVLDELAVVNALPPGLGLRLRSVQATPDGLSARTRKGIELRLGDRRQLRLKLRTAAALVAAVQEPRVVDVSVPAAPAVQERSPNEGTARAFAAEAPPPVGSEEARTPDATVPEADVAGTIADLFVRARP